MATIVDETVLLRYLLDDDPQLSKRAAEVIATRDVRVYPEIVTRTIVTLRDVYGVPRNEVAHAMELLLDDVLIDEPTVTALAIRLFGKTHMDFTDCLLSARTAIYGDNIMSFGKPLIEHVIEVQHAQGGAERDEE